MSEAISDSCAATPERDQSVTVLAIDTTAGQCSVALLSPDGCMVRVEAMIQGHSRAVLPMVDGLLGSSGIAASAIDLIGFGSGPGSFTGLRVACGVAQGLGFGWGRPLVAVDAMRTLALQAAQAAGEAGASPAWLMVALDVRMGEVCHAVFRYADLAGARGWPVPVASPVIGSPAQAMTVFDEFAGEVAWLAGDGFQGYPALADWAQQAGDLRQRPDAAVQPDALAVARLALLGWQQGRSIDAALAAPDYLRDKVALDVTEQAALRATMKAARDAGRLA
jgi:tRNA threonylcarbamoyladenosine biosynthesis protein TsaB